MNADRDGLERRLARANPFDPMEVSSERAEFERALRDTILADRLTVRRPRFTRRRAVALGIGIALLAAAGVSVAVLNREAPPNVKATAELDPETIPPAFRPVADTDPRLLIEHERDGRSWQVWGSQTAKGTDLLHVLGPGSPAPTLASFGCPRPGRVLRVCSASSGRPDQTVVGRVGNGVASVVTVGVDGTRTPATLGDGFFLSVAETATVGVADRVEAVDAAGNVVSQQPVMIVDENGNVVRP